MFFLPSRGADRVLAIAGRAAGEGRVGKWDDLF
jgi:hypothetical protein